MEVQISDWKEWHIVTIEGDFVVKHLAKIREQVEKFLTAETYKIAFNLEKISYIDSSAITLLLNFQKKILEHKGVVVIFGPNKDVQSIFSIIGLNETIRVFDTKEDFEKTVKI